MAAPIPLYHLPYYNGLRLDTAGFDPSWQEAHTHAAVSPVHADGDSQADAILFSETSMSAFQNGFGLSATALDAGFSGLDGHANELNYLSGSPDTMLPQNNPAVALGSQFGEWNWVSSMAPFAYPVAGPSSMLSLSCASTLNQAMMTGFGGFGDLSTTGAQNTWPSDAARDPPSLVLSGITPPLSAIPATKFPQFPTL
jgi:hypothetical protein